MKRLMLYIVLSSCVLFSCGDSEDDLTPSNVDKNWLIIEDNPDDEVDHKRYLLFEEYGMPIYYNDTIGQEEITYAHGGTYTRYEILRTFYRPSSLDGNMYGGHFSLCPLDRKQDLLPALDMLEMTILPRLSDRMLITSILLVDTLLVTTTGIGDGDPVTNYKGFNTWLIGDIFAIDTMSTEEKEEYGINLLIDLTQKNNTALATEFYAVTTENFSAIYSETSDASYSYPMGNGTDDEILYGFPFAINVAELFSGIRLEDESSYPYQKLEDLDYLNLPEDLCLETLGFLNPMRELEKDKPKYLWLIPTQQADYNDYCQALFDYTPDEFRAKYAAYPLVLEKYEIVKQGFEDYGFSFE